jgi:hypothetical protein
MSRDPPSQTWPLESWPACIVPCARPPVLLTLTSCVWPGKKSTVGSTTTGNADVGSPASHFFDTDTVTTPPDTDSRAPDTDRADLASPHVSSWARDGRQMLRRPPLEVMQPCLLPERPP